MDEEVAQTLPVNASAGQTSI